MDPLGLALVAGLVPALTAGLSLLLWRKAPGLAVAAGYAAGHLASRGLPRGIPNEAWQWLLPLALAGAGLAALEGPGPWRRWLPRTALVAGLLAVTLPREGLLRVAVSGLLTLALLASLDGLEDRLPPAFGLGVLAATSGAGAAALLFSGSVLQAELGGSLAAALGACLLLRRWRPPSPAGRPLVAGTLLAGLLLNGVFYSDLPVPSALLLAGAPAAALSLKGPGLAARGAAAGLLAGAGAAVAFAHSPPLSF